MRERLGARMTGKLTLLAASMRAAGVRVGVGELLSAHRALSAVDPADREAAYFALRATLCSRHDDLAAFDAAFAEWFLPAATPASEPPPAFDEAAKLALPRTAVPADARMPALNPESDVVPAAWSDLELLRDKDFADYTEEERRRARQVMRRLATAVPARPSRR
ncbi:MAG: hypothetical protein H0T69_01065, partial [Thermoleophilaceae bacterium]|nr:hypothetical protein [Thermoleophilaceae bacterium]